MNKVDTASIVSAISDLVLSLGFKVKAKTGKSITILVTGSRIARINELVLALSHLDAVYDPTMPGSSIGGIRAHGARIIIKADGKSGSLDVEAAAMARLQDSILTAMLASGGPISIRIGRRTVKGVVGVVNTPGTPKSDFHLVDSTGKALAWISHKKGSKPNDFQQWGGVTETIIANDKEVKAFAAACVLKFGKRLPNKVSVYEHIKSKDLKGRAVFGVDFGKGPGINNVDVLLQGDPGLSKGSGDVYTLTASNVHYNGDIPHGGFEPVMTLVYKGDRSNFGIGGARASIYPLAGRKMTLLKDFKV